MISWKRGGKQRVNYDETGIDDIKILEIVDC